MDNNNNNYNTMIIYYTPSPVVTSKGLSHLKMMDRECSRFDPSYQCHITFASTFTGHEGISWVETQVFIVISCNYSEGCCGFNSLHRLGSFC